VDAVRCLLDLGDEAHEADLAPGKHTAAAESTESKETTTFECFKARGRAELIMAKDKDGRTALDFAN
jgi:hypothetical protein